MAVRVIVINILLFVLLVMHAEEIITRVAFYNWSAFTATQLNQMHLIRDK